LFIFLVLQWGGVCGLIALALPLQYKITNKIKMTQGEISWMGLGLTPAADFIFYL